MIRTSVYSSVKAPGRPSPDQKHAHDRPAGATQLSAGTWAIHPVHASISFANTRSDDAQGAGPLRELTAERAANARGAQVALLNREATA
jgi:hypothetical protein